MIWNQVQFCIVCGQPATVISGHVHLPGDPRGWINSRVLAGFCDAHRLCDAEQNWMKGEADCQGCFGPWRADMGIVIT